MSIQLKDVITAARDRHPGFHRTRVPDATVARFLTDYQNELIGKATERDKQFLQQRAAILISFGGISTPGLVGAGTGDGLPGNVDAGGGFSAVEETAGSLLEAHVTQADGAQVLVTERVVTSATAIDLTCNTVGRTVDADIGKLLVITAGTGIGQRRLVLSNTATKWVISTGSDFQQWVITPDQSSLFELVTPIYSSDTGLGVITDLPAVTTQQGYLVKLNAAGVPFIDWTKPLIASIEDGLALPAALAITGGTVRYRDGDAAPLTFVSQGRRFNPPRFPAVYTVGSQLYFCGRTNDWEDASSLEVDYVPIAPAFAQLPDLFLLPDGARVALVAKSAAFMAVRVAQMADVAIDPRPHMEQGQAMEQHFLMTIRLTRRARHIVIQPGNY